ncbi:MAG: hypothetical protein ABI724_04945 [Betaproteobacteria bacterium]
MPTARELLQQADALMRRNRANQIDTEIPELTEAVLMTAPAPLAAVSPPPLVLDDIPELMDSVEEIEIASIVELPEDDVEPSGWPRSVRGDADGRDARAETANPPMASHPIGPIGGRVLPLFAIAAKPIANAPAIPAPPPVTAPEPVPPPSAELPEAKATVVGLPAADPISVDGKADLAIEAADLSAGTAMPFDDNVPAIAEAVDLPALDTPPVDDMARTDGVDLPMGETLPVDDTPVAEAIDLPVAVAPAIEVESPGRAKVPAADDWARWEALAEEIRMQVLQRIDIFTDTGLREQLSVQMQPIVERASAELIATINGQVGKLLRAYIADAIEREIEKWRTGNS